MLVMRAVLALAHVMYAHHTHIPNVNLNKRMLIVKKLLVEKQDLAPCETGVEIVLRLEVAER